jgi:hypothetical protein
MGFRCSEVISEKMERTPGINHARGAFRGGSQTVRTCPETGVEP